MTWIEKMKLYPGTLAGVSFRNGPADTFRFMSELRRIKKELTHKISPVAAQFKVDNPGIHFQKYLDLDHWVLECLRRVYQLDLSHSRKKLSILDLGTGAGYFPYICKYYGHRAEALDVPDNPMYNDIIKSTGVHRYGQYITKFKDIDVNGKYDLITGFMICFNNHKSPGLWHIEEWKYFLHNLKTKHLNDGGRVFLSFNSESEHEVMHPELLEWFRSQGGVINAHEIMLRKEDLP
jgi:hypothetical protein